MPKNVKVYEMDDKDKKFVEAAITAFMRYGVRKTTMADIAEAAGVSRQTLYASFANKDDVLVAAIRHITEETRVAVEAGWASATSLSEKLDIYFEKAVVEIFLILKSAPDADDVVSGFSEAGKAASEAAYEAKRQTLEKMLTPYLEDSGASAVALSDFIQTSSAAYKYSARDEAHLRDLLGTLKTAALGIAGAEKSAAA